MNSSIAPIISNAVPIIDSMPNLIFRFEWCHIENYRLKLDPLPLLQLLGTLAQAFYRTPQEDIVPDISFCTCPCQQKL